MSLFDSTLLDRLETEAKTNPRLRVGYDLRTSSADTSQRMFNSLYPGTVVPIHRHRQSDETMIVIRGAVTEVYYDEKGRESARYLLSANTDTFGIQIPAGQWHTVIVTEPCTIIEIKDGVYSPLPEEDILSIN